VSHPPALADEQQFPEGSNMGLYKSSNTPWWLRLLRVLGRLLRWLLAGPRPGASTPAAPDCVAPTSEYVVGEQTMMTPAALEQLWLLQARRPANDVVLRPAVPDPADGQAGDSRD
jgi:hypothetical protein